MNQQALKKCVEQSNVEWKKHVVQRMVERGITRNEVIQTILEGEVIRDYPDDIPCPSALFLSFVESRPIHVVAAYSKIKETAYIITAYEPSPDIFTSDFKTKRTW